MSWTKSCAANRTDRLFGVDEDDDDDDDDDDEEEKDMMMNFSDTQILRE